MQLIGSTSWRFAESVPQLLHAALYIRDAVGLAVPAQPELPPPLDADVPDHSGVLTAEERAIAGADWPGWWRELVGQQLHAERPAGPDDQSWAQQRMAAMLLVSDPPDFETLADRPALRKAVRAVFFEGCQWADGVGQAPEQSPGPLFSWELTRDVAEEVAFDRGIDLGTIDGRLLALKVRGQWWQLIEPGGLLCSMAVAADPTTSHVVLRKVFGA